MTMDSPMLSPRNGDPCEFNSLSVALPFSEDASGSLANIVNVGKGSRTFKKCSEQQQVVGQTLIAHSNAHELARTM